MKEIEINVNQEIAFDSDLLNALASEECAKHGFKYYLLKKRSIDARKGVSINVRIELTDEQPEKKWKPNFKAITSKSKQVIIVGAGPAGLFAALQLLELGVKPIIVERGKDLRDRRRDIAAINKEGIVNSDSNYCFGEGGAGTYSDGKLYTRSKKRGDVVKILEILNYFGATDEILYDSHPHIGTNKLPNIIKEIREKIINLGGEVHFNTRIVDFSIKDKKITGVKSEGKEFKGDGVILATGHSARDIFSLLNQKNIRIENKPFALGVRVEHYQSLIDKSQYHCEIDRGPYLPASNYSLTHQATVGTGKRGVFSFCMCPGGFIVPSATAEGEVVVNGMSPSRRNSRFANSGIVVQVEEADLKPFSEHGVLAGLEFQKSIEQAAFKAGGGKQVAPAQRVDDFIRRKTSSRLHDMSYQPGIASIDMAEILPVDISKALRQGLIAFGKLIKGFDGAGGQIIGVESRTSSPVRIPRDKETLEHVEIERLFPCGEGAGFAGGIVSAAMDGVNTANAFFAKYK